MRVSPAHPETPASARPAATPPGMPRPGPVDGPPMSIGLVCPVWPPDAYPHGVVSYTAALADGLRALGHRATVLAAYPAPGDWGEHVHDLGLGAGARTWRRRAADALWYRLATRSAIEARAGRHLAAAIARAVDDLGIEVLEMEEAFGWAARVRRSIRIPLSVRLHGPWFLVGPAGGEAEGGAYRRRVAREGRAIRLASSVTSPSLDALERSRARYGLALERAEVVPNPTRPIPTDGRWDAAACEPGTVLFVGRFDHLKGGDLIVEAFARVLRDVPGARLDFAGRDHGLPDGAGGRWTLERFVDDRLPGARAAGRVRLLGPVPHSALAPLRRASAVSVVCSRYEVFGLALAEAMAMGCPAVAARVGGIPEFLADGVDGLLHRPGDPDDLAARIVELLADPARAAELGRRAAARCERELHPVAVAARMAAHYRRLAAPAADPARAPGGRERIDPH